VELPAIKALIAAGVVVVTCGGGGIPVVADEEGNLQGVAAVIDKDLASALLANDLDAELLIISTAVEKVSLNFGTPQETQVDHMTLAEAKAHLDEGVHFAKGSMAPKIQAIVNYLSNGGTAAIVTNPENVARALHGETGTLFTRE
jgi:carbamate kinase